MSTTSTAVPNSSDACMTIVRSLMCYRMGGENETFSRRAIESLVKKLKEKREELDSLITAVTTSGTHPSICVTIQRTLDGRLQVAGRKGFPHVMYAKIWRWSDVHRSELRHINSCRYAFDLKCDSICVNPYHYDRVVSTISYQSSNLQFNIDDEYNRRANEDYNMRMEDMKICQTIQHHPAPLQAPTLNKDLNQPQPFQEPRIFNSAPSIPVVIEQNNKAANGDYNTRMKDEKISQTVQNYPASLHSTALNNNMNNSQKFQEPRFNLPAPIPIVVEQNNKPEPQQSAPSSSTDYNQRTLQTQATQPYNTSILRSALEASDVHNAPIPPSTKCEQYLQHQRGYASSSTYNPCLPPTEHQHNNLNNFLYNQREVYNNIISSTKKLLSNQPLPEFWCSIAYFELDVQVGEIFKVKSVYPSVTVDGYVDPSGGNRFCLGALCNVHQTDISERTRPHIGRGIVLELRDEGDIWLKCESEHSVFVQSHYLDVQAGRASGNTVHKIHSAAYLKVFDLHKCHNHMRAQVAAAQAATAAQAAAVEGRLAHNSSVSKDISAAAGIGVDDLRRLCILRLSFVKGWGPDYRRHTIKETPCWIEVHLHRALQLLDEVLKAMTNDGLRRNVGSQY